MVNFKCRFCGSKMEDRAVKYSDGEYSREVEFYCNNKKCLGPPLFSNVKCGVCLGKPLESGRKCICNGVGTESAELQGFRDEYYKLNEKFENLEAELDAVMLSVDKWLEGKELKNNPATRAADAREKVLRILESKGIW